MDTLGQVAEAIKGLRANPALAKAIDLATGLTGFNLEAPAKLQVPLLAPFRQSIGRRVWPGNGTNWKAITAVTPTGTLKAAEATKANAWALTKVDKSTTYGSYGRAGSVTWEGQLAGMNFEDVRARDEAITLLQFLREEEACILGGHAGTALGASPTITAVAAAAGGALVDDQYFFMIVSLTMAGAIRAGRIMRPTPGTNKYDFLAADGQTLTLGDGHGLVSAEANATVAGGGGAGQVTLTWTPDPEAVAYAVYCGLTTGAANLKLQGVVSQTEVIMTSFGTLGAAASLVAAAGDTSNSAPFSGILSQLVAAGSGAYTRNLNNPLSAASGRGIAEIDLMLDDIYDRVKEEPDRLLMGWTEHQAIDDKMSAVANDRVNLNVTVGADGDPGAQMPRFTKYKSSRGKLIQMEENPNIPGGIIIALKDRVALPNSEVPSPWQMHMAAEVMRLDYAMTAPKDEFEVRARGALAGYVPSFQGVLYNIHEA
jgi:hypothetical protein